MATRGKDQICAVRPCGDGILLETLRYEKEVKDSDEVFSSIKKERIDKEMLDLAEELIERKTAAFNPSKFKSHYLGALKDLIDEKRKKGKVTEATDDELEDGGSNVIDLMDALRRSVAKRGGATKTHTAKGSASRSHATARKTTHRKAAAKKARARRKAS